MSSKQILEVGNSFSWVTPKLTLADSNISGLGYTANANIRKDELLIVQSGQCVHVSDIDNPNLASRWYTGFQIEKSVYLYPLETQSGPFLDGVFRVNHSCNPNAGFRGQISLVAMRDIQSGEEITYDYVMTDVETDLEEAWEAEQCLCGADLCRKTITGHDWRLPDLQKRYQGYFSQHVANAIKQLPRDGTL